MVCGTVMVDKEVVLGLDVACAIGQECVTPPMTMQLLHGASWGHEGWWSGRLDRAKRHEEAGDGMVERESLVAYIGGPLRCEELGDRVVQAKFRFRKA
jgi:hypothetical protein